jgi:hypothetical protein
MLHQLLFQHSEKIRELSGNDITNVKFLDLSTFPSVFDEFLRNIVNRGHSDKMEIRLKRYVQIYDTLKKFSFSDIIMRELEKHYKGTKNVHKLSGNAWDLYLPETDQTYEISKKPPKNMDTVKTEIKVKLMLFNPNEAKLWLNEEKYTNLCLYQIKELGYHRDEDFPSWLPSKLPNITKLSFWHGFNRKIDLSPFKALTELYLPSSYKQTLNLENLTLLEVLDCGSSFNRKLNLKNNKNLRFLRLSNQYNQELDLSNQTMLEHLEFGYSYDQELNLKPLINLEKLQFGESYNQEIDLSSQTLLKVLRFGFSFNQELNLKPLINLEKLYFGHSYNQKTDLSNQTSLRVLHFRKSFDQKVNLDSLVNLRELVFSPSYSHEISLIRNTKLKSMLYGYGTHLCIDLKRDVNVCEDEFIDATKSISLSKYTQCEGITVAFVWYVKALR